MGNPDLIVIGGGPIGLEMAQAHRRLGAAVTVLDIGPLGMGLETAGPYELGDRITVLATLADAEQGAADGDAEIAQVAGRNVEAAVLVVGLTTLRVDRQDFLRFMIALGSVGIAWVIVAVLLDVWPVPTTILSKILSEAKRQ